MPNSLITNYHYNYWSISEWGFILSTNGSYDPSSSHGGWGFAVFDSNGYFTYANFDSITYCVDTEEAELIRLHQALLYAKANNLSNVTFVTECLNVVNCIMGIDDCIMWTNMQLLYICRRLFCELQKGSANIIWIPVYLNTSAHILASVGQSSCNCTCCDT